MARQAPIGITIPRTDNTELQRFCEMVVQVLDQHGASLTGLATTSPSTGTGGGIVPTPSGSLIPVLDTPPKPTGVEVHCGIGLCMVAWINPFRFYSNHATAHVYRGTVDQFDNAAELGMAEWLLYVDDTVSGDTEYFYWVRFESTSQILGPPSESVRGRAALSPAEVYAALRDDLVSSPLAAVLSGGISTPGFVTEEIRRLAAEYSILSASAARANEGAIQRLEAISGAQLGPEPNIFTGSDRDACEVARDTQASNAAWLMDYDIDPTNAIELDWS